MAGSPVLAKAWVGLVPTLQGSQKQIAKELDGVDTTKSGEKAGRKFGAAMSVGLLAAGAVMVKGLSDAVNNASDLSESINAVNVSYGDAAEGVLALSKNSATAVGLSSADFNSLAVQFSAFSKTVAGEGGDVVGTLGDITGRAADFASVMNLDVADAAATFQSGLAGETEPLRKYGIDLSAAAVQAYALANGIGDGTGALTEAEKVQARYGLLMQQTSNTQGDFVNTSDGLANSQRVLGANLENISATIGAALVPALSALTGGFNWLLSNGNILIPIVAGLGAVLIAALAPAIWAAVTATWAFTVALLANPMTWVVVAIGALIAGIVALVMNWDAVTSWITDVWSTFTSWLGDTFNNIASWWNDLWSGIGSFVAGVWSSIVSGVQGAALGLWNLIQGVLIKIRSLWESIWKGAVDFIGTVFAGVVGVIKAPINGIIGLINGAIGALNGIRVDIPDWVPFVGGQTFGLSIPTIPYLAAGATVMPTPGGTLAVLAEAGRPESVVDTGLMNRALEEGLAGRDRSERRTLDLEPVRLDDWTIDRLARAVATRDRVEQRMVTV